MYQTRHQQAGFSHILLFGLLAIVIGVIGFAGFRVAHSHFAGKTPVAADKTALFVSAAPFDPEQMETVSKFRSCSGHDYSGKDIDNVVEHDRSMKNYAVPIKSLSGSVNKVKIFAPFDAVVINNSIGKRGDNLDLSPTANPGFVYELGHIAAIDNLSTGSHIKAGQLVGYYNDGGAFDIQFWYGNKATVNTLNGYFDSIFSHMTPELVTKLKPYGLTADALVTSRSYRDAHPCEYSGKVELGVGFFKGDQATDVVVVKNKAATETPQKTQSTSGSSTPSSSSGSSSSSASSNECAGTVPAAQRPPGCSQ